MRQSQQKSNMDFEETRLSNTSQVTGIHRFDKSIERGK